MAFWKKLFGGSQPESSPAPAPPSAPMPRINTDNADALLDCSGVDWNGDEQLRFVREDLGRLVGRRMASLLVSEPFRGNPWCTPLDAAVLFAMQARFEPTRQMEVGSGYTTLALNHARRILNLPGELISVDPEPRCDVGEFVDAQLIMRVEEVPVDDFRLLMSGEVAFFDLPHNGGPGLGLDYVYTQVLPALAPGVLVGFHGVRLPRNYDKSELEQGMCEQDRLLAFLRTGKAEILYSGGWMAEHHPGLTAGSLEGQDWTGESTALWIRIRG